MLTQRIAVTFADLTHTGHSCNAVPYGLAMVAAYALKKQPDSIDAKIFKDLPEFAQSLETALPTMACFSNYIWNLNISYEFAKKIKQRDKQVVVVFGGPNYPVDEAQQVDFLFAHPDIDFYVCKEGEQAFVELFNTLCKYNFDVSKIKKDKLALPNCHYLKGGQVIRGPMLPAIADLDQLASPYLNGLCDKFLKSEFVPLMQTTRGCPFNCTYCQEGDEYFKDVRRFSFQRIKDEIEYIAKRTNVPNLSLADANFGMYKEDLKICKAISLIQKKYGWPKYFIGIDGKNQKKRVLEAASIVKGSYLNAAVQSTDKVVLKNIKRQNVSLSEMVQVAKGAELFGANSFSEVILCLPGDTKEAHFKSNFDLIDAGMNVVRSHQFIMLLGSESSTIGSRREYGMKTGFRVVPSTVKPYQLFGRRFFAPEIDEICVGNTTMSFEDYLECRQFNLTVEIFYNNGIFQELLKLLRIHSISISSFIMNIHKQIRSMDGPLVDLYDNFLRETRELWETKSELEEFLQEPGTIERYLSAELGNNEQLVYRAVAVFNHIDQLHKIAFGVAGQMLNDRANLYSRICDYLNELSEFSLLRKIDIFSVEKKIERQFHYDFVSLLARNFDADPLYYLRPEGTKFIFSHTEQQRQLIAKYIKIYGLSNYGLGNILSNASHISNLYREVSAT